ncbi:antiviral reverse transcriptase Drt2 [Acinetobacter indicus]|uniref:antiviral reverse transcriptase Drt2 n=1 Tax=Acinetobacter indicus TaxID=756892 RepID=UPI0025B05501|nr:antiviral reverse transcriptase Drt2 [Acinetobacter indicus]
MINIDSNFFKNRQKSYLHFDYPMQPQRIYDYVTNPKNIEKHAFYPFIHFELKSQKIKKDKTRFIRVPGKKPRHPIVKCAPKIRPIKYSSHIDGHIYAYYAALLTPKYEKILQDLNLTQNILAFRKLPNSPNNIDFAKRVFDEIKLRQDCAALCFDIKSFFDELDHKILKKAWMNILNSKVLPKDHYQVYKAITKFSYVNKKEVYQKLNLSINKNHRELKRLCSAQDFREKIRKNNLITQHNEHKGIPQGSAISAFLSNIYMLDFDKEMKELLSKYNATYYRYCDDILIICDRDLGLKLSLMTEQRIKQLKVQIHPDKTKRVYFKNGIHVYNLSHMSKQPLQYLGFIYDGKKILLRDIGLTQYHHKTSKAIRMSNKKFIKINEARISRGEDSLQPHKKHIYRRFSYMGKRNYVSYALRAAKIMNEPHINKQIKSHWQRLQRKLQIYEEFNTEYFSSIKNKK